jgi:hypothetical protein
MVTITDYRTRAAAPEAGPVHLCMALARVLAQAAEAALSGGRIAQAEKLGSLAAELRERGAI